MLKEESIWIRKLLEKVDISNVREVLDVGSSSREFRTQIQPYINENVFRPLRERNILIYYLDKKDEEGVNYVCDVEKISAEKFKKKFGLVICCSLLEHVRNHKKVASLLIDLVKQNGFLLVTVPHTYRYHSDPIDTMFRPSMKELISLFPEMEVIQKGVVRIKDMSKYNFWEFVRYIIPPLNWKVNCLLLKKQSGNSSCDTNLQETRAKCETSLRLHAPRGDLLPRSSKHPIVCIVQPNKFAYSETFIRAHVERLPTRVRVLYGGWFPSHIGDGNRPLLGQGLPMRVTRALIRRTLGWKDYRCFEYRALYRFLKRERVVAVLAEYGQTGVNVMETCRKARVPLIVHFHGGDASDKEILRKYKQDYRHMFEHCSAIIAVSQDMENQLLDLGAPREKLHYIPYGVDCELFSPGNPAANAPIFLAVGRFVEKKAPHLTLLAFREVLKKCHDARLVMIGDGHLLDACKQLTSSFHLSSAVEFLAPCRHEEVAVAMRAARAFVQHSVRAPSGDSEGTPVAVLEAGASGLPVIATRHAGIKDVVIENKTGLLVSEGDVQEAAAHMVTLAKDPHLAASLGKAARKHICTKFSMEKSIEQLWKLIQGVMEIKSNR